MIEMTRRGHGFWCRSSREDHHLPPRIPKTPAMLRIWQTNCNELATVSITLFLRCQTYPLVMTNIANWKITMINGKIHYKWSFSIAMLNYQRVVMKIARSASVSSLHLDIASTGWGPRKRKRSVALCLWLNSMVYGRHTHS